MEHLAKLHGLDWLVAARNEIQSFLLELHKLHKTLTKARRSTSATPELKQWNLFLGAAFSLWRAVFLVNPNDVKRKTGELAEKADEFLLRVVETNAITFSDELRTRSWSAGYYLNNARYRVKGLATDYGVDSLRESISNAVLKDVWNETYATLRKAFANSPHAVGPPETQREPCHE